MSYRKLGLLLVLALVAFVVLGVAVASAGDDPQPVDFTHNGVDAPAPIASAVFGSGPTVKIGTPLCSTTTSTAANVNTDCETKSVGPHNETSIAVNPTDPNNIIGGVNDYQLAINPGGHVSETLLSRAHVSFDGGKTWTEYPLNANSAYQATGDPRTRCRIDLYDLVGVAAGDQVAGVQERHEDAAIRRHGRRGDECLVEGTGDHLRR